MSSRKTLLPPNATELERNIAEACAAIEDNDTSIIVRVTRADEAPAKFLPYLAWEVSVNRWSDDWPDATKRKVIKNSFAVHKRKGTIASVRRVIEPFGFAADFVEWWQETPPATPGTFKIYVNTLGTAIDQETSTKLVRLIDATKPLSRHLTQMNFEFAIRGDLNLGAATYSGEIAGVWPQFTPELESRCRVGLGGRDHTIETTTVWPLYVQQMTTQAHWRTAGRDHTIDQASVYPS